jgi:hypothetical protein
LPLTSLQRRKSEVAIGSIADKLRPFATFRNDEALRSLRTSTDRQDPRYRSQMTPRGQRRPRTPCVANRVTTAPPEPHLFLPGALSENNSASRAFILVAGQFIGNRLHRLPCGETPNCCAQGTIRNETDRRLAASDRMTVGGRGWCKFHLGE